MKTLTLAGNDLSQNESMRKTIPVRENFHITTNLQWIREEKVDAENFGPAIILI